MKNYNPMLLADFYKLSHRSQYPVGTEKVYSTWTCRSSRMEGVDKTIFFGLQKFIKEYLIEYFNENFFNRPFVEVKREYQRMIAFTLGECYANADHLEELHSLGHLPITIKAVKEGTAVPIRVPSFTIENTQPKFFWLTNFLETLMSCEVWQSITSATIALQYRKIVTKYAYETVGNIDHVGFQCHDFSMRGMSSLYSAISSGIGHLLSFEGTDTIPAIMAMERYYNSNVEKELVGASIPATEHSVMCCYGNANEKDLLEHLVKDVYPTGLFSVVSDTWDLWKVLTTYLPLIKEDIMDREGRCVIRPDSGDPVKILCGDDESDDINVRKGVIELLWDTFGGTVNELGYKMLDPHIGAIYGDSITLGRCEEICERLKAKGFASSNVVFGVGSFTYQYNTRDTFSQALKATYAVVNGEERLLFKDPITDSGMKRSQRGMVAVIEKDGEIGYVDGLNKETIGNYEATDLLEVVFEDGKLVRDESLQNIRARVRSQVA